MACMHASVRRAGSVAAMAESLRCAVSGRPAGRVGSGQSLISIHGGGVSFCNDTTDRNFWPCMQMQHTMYATTTFDCAQCIWTDACMLRYIYIYNTYSFFFEGQYLQLGKTEDELGGGASNKAAGLCSMKITFGHMIRSRRSR